ncbi:GNAT family N-acetyltransferase [Lacticaseibacillus mingshuiensis]|uniref:GNAT family N-acetyltransferase n=1 Tax=Lacticaseibacillus mingshuiensis TaxID=2799574 RepID=UPI00194E29BE|nr:GNAT family N-acetyltransferase [Lacticaseibacillus mingshuiensis]
MQIDEATTQQILEIGQMEAALTREMAALAPTAVRPAPPNIELIEQNIRSATSTIFVASDDGMAIGFAIVSEAEITADPSFVPHQLGLLQELWVAPSHRREHVGRALLNASLSWATQRHLDFLQLNVLQANEAARAFYRAVGFSTTQLTMSHPLTDNASQFDGNR